MGKIIIKKSSPLYKPLKSYVTLIGRISLPLLVIAKNLSSLRAKRGNLIRSRRRKLLAMTGRRKALLTLLVLLVPLGLYVLLRTPAVTEAAWWQGGGGAWQQRKRLTVTNSSSDSLAANTTVAITVNTKALFDSGKLQNDCDDLRIVYQPNSSTHTQLSRYVSTPAGTTCATSTATKVYLPLQATLASSSSTTSYYMYYKNPSASAPANPDNAFDIGSKDATLVCPFDGSTTCAAGETPSTESGAIRYSGAKTALSFNANDKVESTLSSSIASNYTVEAWVNIKVGGTYTSNRISLLSGACTTTAEILIRPATETTTDPHYVELGKCGAYNGTASTGAVSLNAWHHIAVTVNSSKLVTYYIDGVSSGTYDASAKDTTIGTAIGIGYMASTRWVNGYIDEYRISNKVRYTSNFTPPTAPFVRDGNTKLLLHFDENGDDPRNSGKAIDDSGNGNHGTITGAKYVAGLVGVDGDNAQSPSVIASGTKQSQSYASHQGIFIEEGTTNKITNPSFDHSTFDTNWTAAFGGLNYDSSTDTFTAGMAKRNAPGPFAGGVIMGGKWATTPDNTTDTLTAPEGSQIAGELYDNIDGNQGSVVFWVTPEWDGNDNLAHFFVGTPYFSVLKNTTNYLAFQMAASPWTIYDVVDISSWSAGTTYQVVARWDLNNTLDGTNYLSVSVNDTHTFSQSSSISWSNAISTVGISHSRYHASALIEGLTIYRRPLFAGASDYGIDVGNGDEIASIYNSGTGKDPTLITGSWDVVFALPTNSTTGALSTGTGEAWSHPHSSNLLYTDTTNTGGFMLNGTYGTDGWVDEGTPTSVSALATSEKIFAGGYKTVSDAANEGIYYDLTVTAGDDWVVRALAHSDGTSVPKIILYDQTNSAEIGSLTGTTTSTRAAPDVFIFTGEAPAGMTTLRVKLINTATTGTTYWHQVEVLSNLITNPSMETGTGDPWIPTGWSNNGLEAGDSSQNTTEKHSGSASIEMELTASNEGVTSGDLGLSVGNFVGAGAWAYDPSGTAWYDYRDTGIYKQSSDTDLQIEISGAAWTHYPGVGRVNDSGKDNMRLLSRNTGNTHFDDVYTFQLTDVSLTVTPATEANSTESSGLRVDGTDTLTQPITELGTSSGSIEFKFTPRHDFADADKFGVTSPVIGYFDGDGNDYIDVYRFSDSVLRVHGVFSGSEVYADWGDPPTLNAGTTYAAKITYEASGNLALEIDGVEKASNSGVVAFGTAPATAYFGSDNSGANQYDLTIDAASVGYGTFAENTSAPYYKFGSKSAQLTGSADYPSNYTIAIDPNSTSTHTLSAYVYDATSGNVGGTVDGTIANLIFEDSNVSTTYTDAGGGWWRLTYSAATTDASNNYGVYAALGKDIYIDGIQLEEKSYATTYADGTMGTGYSWSGTAHESTSSRTAAGLQYLSSGNISNGQSAGSVSFWTKSNWKTADVTNSSTRKSYISSNASGGNYFAIYYHESGVIYFHPFTSATALSNSYSVTGGNWYHVVATWDNGADSLCINDSCTTGSYTPTAYSPTTLFIDSSGSSPYAKNAAISDLRIYDDALTAAEVTDLYQSGLVSHSEARELDAFGTTSGQAPVSAYHFDEGYGTTANDSTKNANNLTISGASWLEKSRCREGNCLSYDGSNDYASRTWDNDFDFGTDSFSLSGWFRHPSSISGTDTLLARHSSAGFKIYMNSSGYICVGVDDDSTFDPDDSACTTTSYADSQWHHFEAVKDATTSITLHIDGVQKAQDASLAATGSLSSSNTSMYVGIDTDASSNPWAGAIDELKIFDYARSAAQIKADFAKGGSLAGQGASLGAKSTDYLSNGLVGYWKMDESSWNGTPGEVIDSSGNGNNGTASCSGACSVPTTGTGEFGNAGDFDGTDDYVNIGDQDSFSFGDGSNDSAFSVAAWVKMTDATSFPILMKAGDTILGTAEWVLTTRSDDTLRFRTYPAGPVTNGIWVTSSSAVTSYENTWTFVVATYDGSVSASGMKLYLNGGLLQSASGGQGSSGAMVNGTGHLTIGTLLPGDAVYKQFASGQIDEARIYNRALSPREVRDLYNWAPGPVAHWKMDENTGTSAYDSSGNAITGTLTSGPTWTNGKFGGAVNFDGSDDFITAGTSSLLDFTGGYTVSAWVNRATTQNSVDSAIFSKISGLPYDGFMLWYNGDTVDLYVNGGIRANSTTTIAANTWTYVTARWDGTNAQIYINGVLDVSSAYSTAPISSGETIKIGRYNSNRNFTGKIDDVRIYNYARSQKQIVQDMNAGHPSVGSPVGSAIGHWRFDETQGQTANDSGSAGNNGTLGATSSSSTDDPTWKTKADCKVNGCLDFDGGDYVSIPDSLSLEPDNISVSVWLKKSSSGSTFQGVVDKGRDNYGAWSLNVDETAGKATFKARLGGTNRSIVASTDYPTGQWVHIVGVYNGSTLAIYQNGVLSNSASYSGSLGTNDLKLFIGSANSTGDVSEYPFIGSIDEVKIYNYALTEDEVKLDYNAGSAVAYSVLGASEAADLADGAGNPPVAEWNMDEAQDNQCAGGTNDVCDTSGNGNDGAISGNPVWTAGHDGAGLSFDGSGDVVTVSALSSTAQLTVEAWIKVTQSGSGMWKQVVGRVSGSDDGTVSLAVREDLNTIRFSIGNANSASNYATTSISYDTWTHLAGVYDGSNISIYKDGVLGQTVARSAGSVTITPYIGAWSSVLYNYSGLIDQVKIYDYARTPAQIAYDYNGGAPVAHWRLDECSGSTVYSSNDPYDSSLDGTITIGATGDNTSLGTCGSGTGTEAWNNGTTGKFNASLDFDGTDDYVSIPDSTELRLGGDWSISAWVKPESLKDYGNVFWKSNASNNQGYGLITFANGSWDWQEHDGTWTNTVGGAAGTLSNGTWTFLTVTYDGTNVRTYTSGTLITTAAKNAITSDTGVLEVGTDTDNTRYFDGQIDDVQIFNYALSAAQIRKIYNQGGAVRFGPDAGAP